MRVMGLSAARRQRAPLPPRPPLRCYSTHPRHKLLTRRSFTAVLCLLTITLGLLVAVSIGYSAMPKCDSAHFLLHFSVTFPSLFAHLAHVGWSFPLFSHVFLTLASFFAYFWITLADVCVTFQVEGAVRRKIIQLCVEPHLF